MSMPPTLPPQGWYPDPQVPGQQRWWDGKAWGPQAPTPPPPAPPGAPGAAPGGLLGRFEQEASAATSDPQGFYHQHEKTIDTVGGGALLAEGLGVMPRVGRSSGGPIAALMGIVVGVIFAGVGFFMLGAGSAPADETATATGTVSALNMSGSTCSPTATFVVAGKTYTAAAASVSSSCTVGVGSPVVVYYNPTNPTQASVKGSSLKLFALVFLALGILVAISSVVRFFLKIGELGAGGVLLAKGLRRRQQGM